jgi:anti-sigma factor ChrR (cupin superfamily)
LPIRDEARIFRGCRRFFERIIMTQSTPGSHYVDVGSLEWETTRFPGIEMKILWRDPDGEAFTAVFRMAAGARLPRHRHRGVEQTFVLEGSLVDDDDACSAGNFVWRDAGSIHDAHSPDGCLTIGIFQKANEFFDDDGTGHENAT